MGMYPLRRYVPGTFKRRCDVCGWDYLRTQLKKTWDGLIVCQKDWYPKPLQEEGFKLPFHKPQKFD